MVKDVDVVKDGAAMIAGLDPVLRPGTYVFASHPDPAPALRAAAIASFAEDEGPSLILPEGAARAAGLDCALPMAWITLKVMSSLDGVGLTAAVAAALAHEGIACNMVAALRHDHVFVPAARATDAMACLRRLQARGGASGLTAPETGANGQGRGTDPGPTA